MGEGVVLFSRVTRVLLDGDTKMSFGVGKTSAYTRARYLRVRGPAHLLACHLGVVSLFLG